MNHTGRLVARVWRARVAAIGVAGLLASCAKVLGVDGYRVGDGPGKTKGDAGPGGLDAGPKAPATNPCGKDSVQDVDGGCSAVGVASCGSLLPGDAGGCEAGLPTEPCENGGKEEVGSSACVVVDSLPCGRQNTLPLDPSLIQYVNAAFRGASDGSVAAPFTTIKEALSHVVAGGGILIADGDYPEEGLVVDKPGVRIFGDCPAKVHIIGTGTTAPNGYPCGYPGLEAALCFSSNATGSNVSSVGVRGKGDGIAIVGATNVSLFIVFVQQTARFGIRIEETGFRLGGSPTPVSASLNTVSIREAHGAGLYVAGATIDKADKVTVASVLPFDDYLGYGVSILPGGSGAENPTRSNVSLTRAVLIGNADAALHVSGSTVIVDGSYLGSLSGAPATARGVLVERELPRGSPAELTLTGTTIDRTRDAAIDVRSAKLTLDNVTIRNTTSGLADDGCSGQGIRVRADRITPSSVTVRHSLVEGSRQAAIHALGSSVIVEDSVLRGSAPGSAAPSCAPHLGDGITLESLPGGAASDLTVRHSLIDQNARAAIATFGGTISATNTVLSCNGHGVVDAKKSSAGASQLVCGCGDQWRACESETLFLEPWISPGGGSGHVGATTDFHVTVQDFPPSLLPNGIAWLLDAPDVAPAAADSKACAPLLGIPDHSLRRVAIWAPGSIPAAVQISAGAVYPGCEAPAYGAGDFANVGGYELAGPVDLNRAIVTFNASVPPAQIVQSPESGDAWIQLSSYFDYRVNVDPGWHEFGWEGKACAATGGNPTGDAVPGKNNTRRVLLEPGMINNVGPDTNCIDAGPCGSGKFQNAEGDCLDGDAAERACVDVVGPLHLYPDAADLVACTACQCAHGADLWSLCANNPACMTFMECAGRSGCSFASTVSDVNSDCGHARCPDATDGLDSSSFVTSNFALYSFFPTCNASCLPASAAAGTQ